MAISKSLRMLFITSLCIIICFSNKRRFVNAAVLLPFYDEFTADRRTSANSNFDLKETITVAGDEVSKLIVYTNYFYYESPGEDNPEVDILYSHDESDLWLKQTTDPIELKLVEDDVKLVDQNFEANLAFIMTWTAIRHYYNSIESPLSVQIIVVADTAKKLTFQIYNYYGIGWLSIAEMSYIDFGDDGRIVLPKGNGELLALSNVNIPGKWVMRIDGGPRFPTLCPLSFLPPKMSVTEGVWTSGDTIQTVKAGNHTVKCVGDTKFAEAESVILSCGDMRNASTGPESSLHLNLDKAWNQMMCVCHFIYIEGCFNQSSVMNLDVQYGPENVTAGPLEIPSVYLCPSVEFPKVSLYCDVPMDSVNPLPGVILKEIFGNDFLPVSHIEHLGSYRFNFLFTPTRAGIITVKCVAFNSVNKDWKVEVDKTVTVHSPPILGPRVIFNKERIVPNGGIQSVVFGEIVDVKCIVEGGFPSVDKTTLQCRDQWNASIGSESSLTLNINVKEWDGVKCLCKANHTTGCYDKESEFSLQVSCPRLEAPQIILNKETVVANRTVQSVVLGETVEVKCNVKDGVLPVDQTTLQCGGQRNVSPGSESSLTLNIDVKEWDGVKCLCKADDITGCYDKESEFSLQVSCPRLEAPQIILNKETVVANRTVQSVVLGETVEVKCNVKDGVLPVDQTTLQCGGQRNASPGSESSLTLDIDVKEWDGVKCLCKTDDITGCYDKESEFSLQVSYTMELTEGQEDKTFFVDGDSHGVISFDVKGRPPPITYTLEMIDEMDERGNAVSYTPMSPNEYSVTFEEINFSVGRVVLTILEEKSTGMNDYLFTMNNDMGTPLSVTFTTAKMSTQGGDSAALSSESFKINLIVIGGLLALIMLLFYLQLKGQKSINKLRQVQPPKQRSFLNHQVQSNGPQYRQELQGSARSSRLWMTEGQFGFSSSSRI